MQTVYLSNNYEFREIGLFIFVVNTDMNFYVNYEIKNKLTGVLVVAVQRS